MRNLGSLAFLAAALLASGCRRKDPIAHYKVPKEPTWRMLSAIAPTADQTWFFKAVGPGRALAERKDEFTRFLGSVKFVDGKPQWSLPEGWKEEKGGGERLATLKFGREGSLELAVSSLQGTGGGLLANVNRWRGQLGLPKIEEGDLPRETSTQNLGSVQATVIDFEGPTKPQAAPFAGGRAMPPGHPEVEANDREPFTYTLPEGWTRSRSASGGKIEFQTGGARVTITGMDGEAGGLLANVNRWRGQVGLDAVDEEGARKLVHSVVLLGLEGMSLELITSEKAILCIFSLNPGGSIFVKMDGPAQEVEKQRRAFQEFAASLRMKKRDG